MKRFGTILTVLLAVLLAGSCMKTEDTFFIERRGDIVLECRVAGMDSAATKSRLTLSNEDTLSCMTAALYDGDGVLVRSGHFTDLSGAKLKAVIGRTYHLYAVFNCGKVTFPDSESDVEEISIGWSESMINANGFPAVWDGDVTFTADGQTVTVEAARRVSKVRFRIDNRYLSAHSGSFALSSLALRNTPSAFHPFGAAGVTAGEKDFSSDGSTSSDVTAINNGSVASFYTLENRRGTLLPGNTNPWGKVPDAIPDAKDICTYLEAEGAYKLDGGKYSAPITYRMYIGSDAVTNFDLNPNEIYDVTLRPSIEGSDRTSWKVDKDGATDMRSMRFSPSSMSMYCSSTEDFTVTPDPSSMEYSLAGGPGFAAATLTLSKVSGNRYRLTSGNLSSDATTSVVATSWDGKVTATLPVTVIARKLTSVTISPTSATAKYHSYTDFTLTAHYDNGDKEDVTYSASYNSSNTSVASMWDNSAYSKAAGTTTITGSYGGYSASAELIVVRTLSSLSITPSSASKNVGDTVAYTVTANYDDGHIKDVTADASYSSSDESVATMTGNVAVAAGNGTASITASYTEGDVTKTASASLKVNNTVMSVEVLPADTAVKVGKSVYYEAYAHWSDGTETDVTYSSAWKSSDEDVAKQGYSRRFDAVGGGTATISATYQGVTGTSVMRVAGVESLALSPADTVLRIGNYAYFHMTAYWSDGTVEQVPEYRTVLSSGDTTVVKCVAYNRADAVGGGTAYVSASYQGLTASSKITVPGLDHLSISPAKVTKKIGENVYYDVFAHFSDGTSKEVTYDSETTYSSDNESVAKQGSSKYRFDAVGLGVAHITASYKGLTAVAEFAVGQIQTLSIDPTSASIMVGEQQSYKVYATYSGGTVDVTNSATFTVTDQSPSGTAVATMSGSTATGVSVGTCTIQANYLDKSATSTLKVWVKELKSIEISPKTVTKSAGETQTYTVTATYDEGGETVKETVTSDATYTVTNPTGVTVVTMGTTESTKHVATAVNGGEATITASYTYGGVTKTATAKFVTDYPVSLTADCPSYGGTGDWKWDFYKIGASTKPSYTVSVKFYSGTTRTLSTSEYTVSDNTGSFYVDFSTKGIVKMVGSNVNTGCQATVKFSYTDAGKTATLTKTWWKIYVTSITTETDIWYQEYKSTCYLHYNDGSEENSYFSYVSLTVTSSASNIIGIDSYGSMYGRREGVSLIKSSNTFRGKKIEQYVNCHKLPSIGYSETGPAITECKFGDYSQYYYLLVDEDGCTHSKGATISVIINGVENYEGSPVTSSRISNLIGGKEVSGNVVYLVPGGLSNKHYKSCSLRLK